MRRTSVQKANEETIEDLITETEKATTIFDELLERREPLIRQRNKLVDKPFFLFRKQLLTRVSEIDEQVAIIDRELGRHRREAQCIDRAFLDEIKVVSEELRDCVFRLEAGPKK